MRLLCFGLLFTCALPLTGCDVLSGDSGPSDASVYVVSGTITNSTDRPVANATVELGAADGSGSFVATTNANGFYTIPDRNDGDYSLLVRATGYTELIEQGISIEGNRVIDRVLLGPNQVHGQVVNSQDGLGLAAALVAFIRPENSNDNPHLIAVADGTGFFNIMDAPDGTFRLCIRKTGFVEFCRENVQITGGTFALDPIALAETPPAGAIRIVVTWGAAPPDLDAHLTGPLGAANRFHVYYAIPAAGDATLDHDDTNSYGPETITILDPEDGMYRYSIHNWTDRFLDPGTAAGNMAASPTSVQVYNSVGLVNSYTAPAGGSGNVWRVFEMNVSGGTPAFKGGSGGLGYFTATGSDDTTVFLTGGGHGPAPAKSVAL